MTLSPSSPHPVLYGECGYCNQTITNEDQYLPLECQKCHDYFHLPCLRGDRPPVLLGDQLFYFTCGLCDPLGLEHCFRPNLQWVHIIHLALYNLTVAEGGRKGFFRWNDDICGFIPTELVASDAPAQEDTVVAQHSCRNTVRKLPHGISVGPEAAVDGREGRGLTKRTPLSTAAPETAAKKQKTIESPVPEAAKSKQRPSQSMKVEQVQQPIPPSPSYPPIKVEPSPVSHTPLTARQEAVLLDHLTRYQQDHANSSTRVNRLVRKLKVRRAQRNHGLDPFNLDECLLAILATTMKYTLDETKPFSEQAVPVRILLHAEEEEGMSTWTGSPSSRYFPGLWPQKVSQFEHFLVGAPDTHTSITSPYTTRVLKPFIFRSTELQPTKVLVMEELVSKVREKGAKGGARDLPLPYTRHSLDLCYFQFHHLPAVNSLVSHFFWPVDLTECLQYPDFTVVAMYGKLLVGCGFMTPDVKVNEAYISFLVVHPDFTGAGIAKLMLYHLIQTCLGKDVTLHVSVDNPAMLLYQRFGFKAESYCLDFYDKYFPPDHYLSKHAYHMRLRK
ncbi:hypothetical protein EMCRGX_G022092 [Ephydatia muelleri]